MQEEFAGMVARVESLPPSLRFGDLRRGRNSAFEPREAERQVDGLFESRGTAGRLIVKTREPFRCVPTDEKPCDDPVCWLAKTLKNVA